MTTDKLKGDHGKGIKPEKCISTFSSTYFPLFFRKINESKKIHVCLALADKTKNGVKQWKHFKDFKPDINVFKILENEPTFLRALRELNFINEGCEVTSKLIYESWENIIKSICRKLEKSSGKHVEKKIMEPIFQKIAGNASISAKLVKALLQDKYATKLSLMKCNSNFKASQTNRIAMEILYIESPYDKEDTA